MKKAFEGGFNLLAGELLGEGIHRKVFACTVDPSLVVKVEKDEDHRSFANVYEHRNWDENQYYKKVSDWLAPVVAISPCGLVILQKRVVPIHPDTYELPKELPAFLTDIKVCNFGVYDGRLVACDYPMLITTISAKAKRVDWG